jgi:hypothetical protein
MIIPLTSLAHPHPTEKPRAVLLAPTSTYDSSLPRMEGVLETESYLSKIPRDDSPSEGPGCKVRVELTVLMIPDDSSCNIT